MPRKKLSFASDERFLNVLTYDEMIKKLEAIHSHKSWQKPFVAVAILTGARVSEILALRKKDIKWCIDDTETKDNLRLEEVYKIKFFMVNEKQRSTKKMGYGEKEIVVFKDSLFSPLVDILYDYVITKLAGNPETKLFTKTRFACWRFLKKHWGKDAYPHVFRHWVATNDINAGLTLQVVKNKLGWKNSSMFDIYAHFNTKRAEEEIKKTFGIDILPLPEVSKVLDASIVPEVPKEVIIEKKEEIKQVIAIPKMLVKKIIKSDILTV